MLRSLYDKVIRLSESPRAVFWLGVVSFTESSFFPVPPDAMLAPMTFAKPEKAWYYATVCTITSVLGGIFGYLIGMYFFDTVGQWLISVYGHGQQVDEMRELYREWGHWIILIKGMTPIPYKVVTIASGLAGYSLFWFIVLSLITRAVRFFAVAGIFNRFGPRMKPFIEANLGLVTAIMVAFIIGGFVLVKYVV